MMRSVKTIISLTALASTVNTVSASNPECSAHPRCASLDGDCCPTTNFRYCKETLNNFTWWKPWTKVPWASFQRECTLTLPWFYDAVDCCERDSFPDSPAECSAHSECAARGLGGACCPTTDGIYLYCCSGIYTDTTNSGGPNPSPTPGSAPPPIANNGPFFSPLPLQTSGPTPPPQTSGPTPPPTKGPTFSPTKSPSKAPTRSPTKTPTKQPTPVPAPGSTPPPTAVTSAPTKNPTPQPTPPPTKGPTPNPTAGPTPLPTPPPTGSTGTLPALRMVGDQLWDYYQLGECEGGMYCYFLILFGWWWWSDSLTFYLFSDCDFHSDCALGLVCGFRDFEGDAPNVRVYGCDLDPRDFGTGFEDFCHRPRRADTMVIVSDKESGLGKPYPLGLCEGDCWDDDDCQGNLVCEYLDEDSEMRGCTGFGEVCMVIVIMDGMSWAKRRHEE